MTLATRCPRCVTTFRVADAQLRQADGWVRCGRCNEVFKALDSMVDLDQGRRPTAGAESVATPPATTTPAEPLSGAARRPGLRERLTAQPAPEPLRPPVRRPPAGTGATPTPTPTPNPSPPPPSPSPATAGSPKETPPTGAPVPPAAEPQGPELAPAAVGGTDPHGQATTGGSVSAAHPAPLPFARRMRQPARPMSDEARLAWGAVGAFSAFGLALQMLVAWHDPIAQRAPVLRPLVEVVCVIVECRVEAPRRLALVSVESSEFHHLAGSIYRLTTRLRNRDGIALSMPSVDLSMTDANGDLVARKVLQPSDFGSRSRSIGAGQELTLQAVLDTGPRHVAGYTIELFYP